MYTLGVPIGMFVDNKGTRPAVLAGAILLGLGYFPFKASYEKGSGSVALMCFFSYLTGLGGCMAFAASVKTSALNWPHHRGTATAFPLAAFGLSAFFFSFFGGIFFPGDTSDFLMLLAAGTFGMTFIGFFFLRVYPHTSYQAIPGGSGSSHAQPLKRTASQEDNHRRQRLSRGYPDEEPGMSPPSSSTTTTTTTYTTPAALPIPNQEEGMAGPSSSRGVDVEAAVSSQDMDEGDATETSSLMSKSSSLPGDILVQSSVDMDRSHRVDIRGWNLLKTVDFWQLFAIMGILAGIGLMTIKCVSHSIPRTPFLTRVLSNKTDLVSLLRAATLDTMRMRFGNTTILLCRRSISLSSSRCMCPSCRWGASWDGCLAVRLGFSYPPFRLYSPFLRSLVATAVADSCL